MQRIFSQLQKHIYTYVDECSEADTLMTVSELEGIEGFGIE